MTGDSTKSVHGGERLDPQTGSLTVPIYETSTFGFSKAEDVPVAVAGSGEKGYTYSRWDNPTVVTLEKKLALFERGGAGAAFSSGMAAITTTIFASLKKGAHVLAIRDLYGGTFGLLHDILPELGFDTDLVDTTDHGALERGMKKSTSIVYIESPTNPTLKVVDIANVAKLAHSSGALLLVDNTFASPLR
ncbi:MAG: PLP-dependent transferase, partial [Nitrososphaerota archaeon]|nr:PLP-dependent transferase [Nitrososphaerota archaeon]